MGGYVVIGFSLRGSDGNKIVVVSDLNFGCRSEKGKFGSSNGKYGSLEKFKLVEMLEEKMGGRWR